MTKIIAHLWDKFFTLTVLVLLAGAIGHLFFPHLIDPILWSSTCHQDASRSFSIGGEVMPICGRCTGIYFGFLLARLAIGIDSFRVKLIPLYTGLILLMILDWSLGYFNLIYSSNILRMSTGLAFGIGYFGIFHAFPIHFLKRTNLLLDSRRFGTRLRNLLVS